MYRLYKGSQGHEREVKWQAGQRKMLNTEAKQKQGDEQLTGISVARIITMSA